MKRLLFFLVTLFVFFNGCGPQEEMITVHLSVPISMRQVKAANSKNTTPSNSIVSVAPIHVFVKVTDDAGNVVFGPSVVVGGSASDYPSGTLAGGKYTYQVQVPSFRVRKTANKLIITGHYFGKGLETGQDKCTSPGFTLNTPYYFSDFSQESSFTIDLSGEEKKSSDDKTVTLTPTLTPVTASKLAFQLKLNSSADLVPNYDPETSNYVGGVLETLFVPSGSDLPKLTTFFLYDPDSGTRIKDPCTHFSVSGRINQYGRVVADLPIKLSDTYHFDIAVDQFDLKATDCSGTIVGSARRCTNADLDTLHDASSPTPFIYDIWAAAASYPYVASCTVTNVNGTQPADSLVNTFTPAYILPIFWKLEYGSTTISNPFFDPTTDSFLDTSSEMLTSQTICGRVSSNFNPRFADVPTTPTNIQTKLQPTNPIGTHSPYTTSDATYVSGTSDLTLVDPDIYTNFLEDPALLKTTDAINGASLLTKQDLNIKCSSFYAEKTSPAIGNTQNFSPATQAVLGSINLSTASITFNVDPFTVTPLTSLTWADCTSPATKTGTTYGLAKYFNEIAPNTYKMFILFYYHDTEGYVIANSNYTSSSPLWKSQPSPVNPLAIKYGTP